MRVPPRVVTGKSAAQGTFPSRGALYDWECRHVHKRTDQDVGFWLGVARHAGGPVLELACGTGRVTLPLAAAGVEIVGLDRDLDMLSVARRLAPPAGRWPLLLAADMRRFWLTASFGAVVIPYNSLQLLTDEGDLIACLRAGAGLLAQGGVVGVEITDFQAGAAGGAFRSEQIADAEGVRLTGSLVHDLSSRTSRYQRRFSGPGWAREDEEVLRSLNREELGDLLELAGLTATRWWGQGPTWRVLASRAP